jgi:hypothetical protein
MAFFELRQYKIYPGKMDEWMRLMEEQILPFQVSKGMVVTGIFRAEQDDTVFLWMRRFENEQERERLYEAVYQTEHWKTEIGPRITELMDRSAIQVTRIVASAKSPLH